MSGLLLAASTLLVASCGAGESAAPATPVPSGVVFVEAKEYQFIPSSITVAAGSITFSVKNIGTTEHEFEIFRGDQVVDEVEGLVPGLTKDLTVTLPPGDYVYECRINGHNQLGMKGTLTVTPG